jgi:DNA polymerase III epsilon subunit family exonuclease
VFVEEAARRLFALRHVPGGLARSLLDEVVGEDSRLAWRGDAVGLADPPGAELLLESATFVVVDLETTGLTPRTARICEIGAVRIHELEIAEEFEMLVDPGMPIAPAVQALTGLRDIHLRGQPHPAVAVRQFLEFAGDAVLVAHNARFDLAFLDRETERLTGGRLAGPVVDTVGLARRLLAGRTPRVGLSSLAHFFGTAARPCHRALPDAQATAEILLHLLGLAQERGARTIADLVELAAPRVRQVYAKRVLAFGAPTAPGVYLFRDAHENVLYVGRARNLRARLRSYFRSDRQRPAVESPLGPLKNRTRARLAARALRPDELDRPELALPRLRRRLRDLVDCRRFEDAARLRDRIAAVEDVVRTVRRLERLRATRCCVITPSTERGYARGIFVAGGRIADVRTLASRVEVEAGLAAAERSGPEEIDELLLVATFLRRPPPELRVAPLEADEILRLAAALPRALAGGLRAPARARAA